MTIKHASLNLRWVLAALSLALSGSAAFAADVTTSASSETTTSVGEPTIIQHVESKMEPTAIQTKQTVDEKTGVQTTETAPIIMERHDKVTDTTIIQPEVVETKTTKQEVVKSAPTRVVTHHVVRKHYSHPPVKHKVVHKHVVHHVAASTTKVNVETTDRAIVKETVIHADRADSPSPAPQVIQKTEFKPSSSEPSN